MLRRGRLHYLPPADNTGHTVEVSAIHDALAPPIDLAVDGNFAHAMPNAYFSCCHGHHDAFADQAPRHRVAVRVDLDRAVVADQAAQLAQPAEWRTIAKRFQPMRLVALEANHRSLAGRAVHTHVRNLTFPLSEMRFERLPAWKRASGDRVLLDVADTTLGLAFCT